LIKKEAEKILEYAVVTIEIECMRNVKMKVIPVITGAHGTISEPFIKHLNNVPEENKIKELQKIAIFGTAHILRKVLM
jgi:hypothetical protein